ncbi:MAG: hypothetical protein ACP5L4_06935, partial [Thermoplasmata archaeon]
MKTEDKLPIKLRLLIVLQKLKLLKYIRLLHRSYLGHKIRKLKKLQFQEIQSLGRFAELKLGKYKFILDRQELHDFQMLQVIKEGKLYEPDVTNYIYKYLKIGQTFMDIG